MYRAVMVFVALAWFPALASAQQPCTTDARHVVNELYRHILERQTDPASADWIEQLQSGRTTVREVVRSIVSSPEYRDRFIYAEAGEGTPYERSIARFYRHMLGRQPDADGQRAFAQMAQQSGPLAVIDQILNSQEYNQQFGDWGVPGSGGVRFCAPANYSRQTTSQIGAGASSTAVFPQRYRVMDRNGDDVLTWAEWRGSRRTFSQHDLNGDGIITPGEVAEFNGVAPTTGQFPASGQYNQYGQYISVDARDRWTDSGISVRAGDVITFDVSGTVQLSADRNDAAGPAGAFNGRRAAQAPLPSQPAGALIARVGTGRVFAIGDQRSIRVPETGRLYLSVNDDHLGDNSGEYRVSISVR